MDRPRLLVVDDDPCTRIALTTLFTLRGWRVTLAGTVAEALARLDPAPRCLILDLDLPGGPGEGAPRGGGRADPPRPRGVVCGGPAAPMRIATVRALGPELLLPKPIEMGPL